MVSLGREARELYMGLSYQEASSNVVGAQLQFAGQHQGGLRSPKQNRAPEGAV